eukprot:298767_1
MRLFSGAIEPCYGSKLIHKYHPLDRGVVCSINKTIRLIDIGTDPCMQPSPASLMWCFVTSLMCSLDRIGSYKLQTFNRIWYTHFLNIDEYRFCGSRMNVESLASNHRPI